MASSFATLRIRKILGVTQLKAGNVRYIGSEAKDIAKSGLTLEEYFGVPGGDYED